MLRRTKALIVSTLVAAAVATPLPAAAAPGPCRAHATTDGSDLTLVVTGQYVARPTDQVELTCHVVQGGTVVASSRGAGVAGAAAVADAVEIPLAPYSICYEVWIWDVTGWGRSHYTNCP